MFFLCGTANALPPGFVESTAVSGLNQAVGLTFAPDGRMFIWEKAGKVWIYQDGALLLTPLIDISEEVTTWHDHGLLGFALDPSFTSNGYIYLLYAVDWGWLIANENADGQTYPPWQPGSECAHQDCVHDTIGRLTRYRCDSPATNPVVDPASRTVLIGHWLTNRDAQGNLAPPHITDGFAITTGAHGVDTLLFAADGTLLISDGDGSYWVGADTGGPRPVDSTNTAERDGILASKEQVGAFRAQLIDCKNGKLLRIDPQTGGGLPSNPFYDPQNPFSSRSRVWARGLRNPFRFSVKPGSGSTNPADGRPGLITIGVVGQDAWEWLSVSRTGGENFGWPRFEGLTDSENYTTAVAYNLDAPNPLYDAQTCLHPYFAFNELIVQESLHLPSFPNPCNPVTQIPSQYTAVNTRPIVDWHHGSSPQTRVPRFDVNGNASAVGIGTLGAPVTGSPFNGNCVLGGAYYTGTRFPPEYRGKYYFSDTWPNGHWINMMSFDSNDHPISITQFAAPTTRAPVCMTMDPRGIGLFYVHYDPSPNAAQIRRITYDCNGNGIADDVDIQNGTSSDCDADGLPDECQPPLNITTFINVLLDLDVSPVHTCLADVNRDQTVDARDIPGFLNRLINYRNG